MAGERDFDCTAAEIAQHVRISLEFIAGGKPAWQRTALIANMLRQRGGGKSECAGGDRFAEHTRDLRDLLGSRPAFHRLVAEHVAAKRSQRGEKSEVDSGAAALGGGHEIRERLPLPADSLRERVEGNRLNVDQIPCRHLADRGLAGRDSDPAVSHQHSRDPMPRSATD